MIRKIRRMFLFTNNYSSSLNRVKTRIQKANLTMATVLSTLASILIGAMLISTYNNDCFKQNRPVYVIGLIASLVILLLSITLAKKHTWIVGLLIDFSYMVYYLFGILIGTITDPDGKTVTFMVLLVFMPIVFINTPIRIMSFTILYLTIYLIICLLNKHGAVLSVDVLDSIAFALLGCVSGCVINHMKVKVYIYEHKLQEISGLDQLTQIKNRNSYEFEVDSIPDMCRKSIGCIYVDVNGLHEVNNEKGHKYGDAMLKMIASEFKNAFSDELTYRIGGDEFIAFAVDKTSEEIKKSIFNMVEKIEKENYHVAVGYSVFSIRYLSLDDLIKTAEGRMYRDKNMYYKNVANREARK